MTRQIRSSLGIIRAEEHRQFEKLIMIPSESVAPTAVRQAMGSVFSNIYAEGYPSLEALSEDESLLGDLGHQIARHHRLGDRRYYQGTEMANLVEALAIRRIKQLFANNRADFSRIFANVQPLSGAPANNAVYSALLQHGDTLMGMNLAHGGHLTHGSPVNRSGKNYRVVSYSVNEETGRLDFDQVEQLAHENNPKLIVAGASAYPWDIDWQRLREIADSLPEKCYLVADISHTAGLRGSRAVPQSGRNSRCNQRHNPQDNDRTARRDHFDNRRVAGSSNRPGCLSWRAGRPTHKHHSGDGCSFCDRQDRTVPRASTTDRCERETAGQRVGGKRVDHCLRRNKYSSVLGGLPGVEEQGRRAFGRKCGR